MEPSTDYPPVTFFYPYPDEIERLDSLDLTTWDFWSHEGKERRRAWILQTYMRLRSAGYEVSISPELPQRGIVVLIPEAEIQESFFDQYRSVHQNLLLVTIRADVVNFRPLLSDADIVQNGKFADGERTFFVPHWPQPGIIPRRSSRGTDIENIVFKGGFGSLRKEFRSDRWHEFLDDEDLTFEISAAETEGAVPSWHDYSTADLVLAVRPQFDDGGLRYGKPASKLINAWHAGVPAILGPEYAYRELRESDLDYIEVNSVDEAMEAVKMLKADPDRYQAMIERCEKRAREFTPDRVVEQWAEVLFEEVPQLTNEPSYQWSRPIPLRFRRLFNWFAVPPSAFELRKQAGYVMRSTVSQLRVLTGLW